MREVFGSQIPLAHELLTENLRSVGRGARVYPGARIIRPEVVDLGVYCQIDESVFLFGGENTKIGDFAHLAWNSCIVGGGATHLGSFVGISFGVCLLSGTEDFHRGLTTPAVGLERRHPKRGTCVIEDHALVFANSVVHPDVTIGEGAVVGAGAVVHRSLKPWGVYAGTPLVQVGRRDREKVLDLAEQERNERKNRH